MAESRRTSRWRYLGPTGCILVALAIVLALLNSPAPVQRVPHAALKTQDVGARTAASSGTPTKAGPNHASVTAATRRSGSTTSTSLGRSARTGSTSTSTTTGSQAGRAGSAGGGAARVRGVARRRAPPRGPNPAGACSGSTPPVAAPAGGWQCTFDDEFNGTSLDT